ncbi:hypothetical protein TYRP_011289 [Tyrophagus putrescentiae]|nr:hypothetical protein TYRP_011289 [Tyrophagus putrescentiae]
MGQTLVGKYQPPPSRQQVDEQMNDLLQTLYDGYLMRRTMEPKWKLHSAREEIASTLFVVFMNLKTIDSVNDSGTPTPTPTTEYTCSHLKSLIYCDESLMEALAVFEWPPSADCPVPPLATPEESLFFFECKHCSDQRARERNDDEENHGDGYRSKEVAPVPLPFQMALPSNCNHPVCPRCLAASNGFLDSSRLVDLYSGYAYQCRLLLCAECGVASSRLLLFDRRNRHLLAKGRSPPWAAKAGALAQSTCLAHRHLYSAISPDHYYSFPDSPKVKYLHHRPTLSWLKEEERFWVDSWLDTAHRHFLHAVIGSDGEHSPEAEELAKVNTSLYLNAVILCVDQACMSRGLEWSLPVGEDQERGVAAKTKDDPHDDDDRCRICFEAVRPLRLYCLLDCCSHRYCKGCVLRLMKTAGESEPPLTFRCPTCRRPVKKVVEYWRYLPQGSPAKQSLFNQVVCVDELFPRKVEENQNQEVAVAAAAAGGQDQDFNEDSWTEVTTTETVDSETETEMGIETARVSEAETASASVSETESETECTCENCNKTEKTEVNKQSKEEDYDLSLTNFLWSLLTGCIVPKD